MYIHVCCLIGPDSVLTLRFILLHHQCWDLQRLNECMHCLHAASQASNAQTYKWNTKWNLNLHQGWIRNVERLSFYIIFANKEIIFSRTLFCCTFKKKKTCSTETYFGNIMSLHQGECLIDSVKLCAEVHFWPKCQMDLAYFQSYDCVWFHHIYQRAKGNYLISSRCNNHPPGLRRRKRLQSASPSPGAPASLLPTSISTSQRCCLPHHLRNLLL